MLHLRVLQYHVYATTLYALFHYININFSSFLGGWGFGGMFCSELELKPQGKLTVVVVKANDLKNMEMIGKSDPYVVLYIRPVFKVKSNVVENNLNPVWDQTFELIAEDKETQSLVLEVLRLFCTFISFCSCYAIFPVAECYA